MNKTSIVTYGLLIMQLITCAFMPKSFAQATSSIAKAEFQFASLAKSKGIKEAFIAYLHPKGYLIAENRLVNGHELYAKATTDTLDLLTWKPTHVFTNTAEDFGFASGPYYYHAKRNQKPIAAGNTFSIWQKDQKGELKILFDGGVFINSQTFDKDYDLDKHQTNEYKLISKPIEEEIQLPPLDETYQAKIANNAILLRPNRTEILYGKHDKEPSKTFLKLQQVDGFDEAKQIYYRIGNLADNKTSLDSRKFCGYFIEIWTRSNKQWLLAADVMQY